VVEDERPPGGAGQRHMHADRPPGSLVSLCLVMSVLQRLLDCIYAIHSSWFDLRA
jgi:hypothetical protein